MNSPLRTIAERAEAFTAVHDKYIRKAEKTRETRPQAAEANDDLWAIVASIRNSKQADKFSALFDQGDTSAYDGDWSAADMALCNDLAFWTRGDAEKMDALFRQSGLMRSKWDRKTGNSTYGWITINKAIADCPEFSGEQKNGAGKPNKALVLTPLSEIKARPLHFLAKPWFPKARITIVAGETGTGKTLSVLEFVRVIAGGHRFLGTGPDPNRGPEKVIYLTKENEADTEIKPRLLAMGCTEAEFENILVFEDGLNRGENGIFISLTDGRLERAIKETRAVLLVVDPIMSYLDKETKSNDVKDVRQALDAVNSLARNTGVTIVAITHYNKDYNDPDPLNRITGSHSFVAVARSVLLVGHDPNQEDNPNARALVQGKASNTVPGKPILFHIEGVEVEEIGTESPRFVFDGFGDFDYKDLFKEKKTRQPEKRTQAVKLLERLLQTRGWTLRSAVVQAAAGRGMSTRLLQEVREGQGLEYYQHDNGRGHTNSFTIWYDPDRVDPETAVEEALKVAGNPSKIKKGAEKPSTDLTNFLLEELDVIETCLVDTT